MSPGEAYVTISCSDGSSKTCHVIVLDSNPWSADGRMIDDQAEDQPGGNDWWAEAIGAYDAWAYVDAHRDDLADVTIGIIDNGFDTEHEELEGKMRQLEGFDMNTIADHGTHVAGIIGARNDDKGIRGVADLADIVYMDNWLENNTTSYDLSSLDAIGRLTQFERCVISNSWSWEIKSVEGIIGKEFPNLLKDYLDAVDNRNSGRQAQYLELYKSIVDYINIHSELANQLGFLSMTKIIELLVNDRNAQFLIVECAGNDGENTDRGGFFCAINEIMFDEFLESNEAIHKLLAEKDITYQTIDDHIIIVAATQKNMTRGQYPLTSWSNYGENVDICAPGDAIFSTLTKLDDEENADKRNEGKIYGEMSGTSMATPMVSAAAALVWQVNPDLTAAQVKEILLSCNPQGAVGVSEDDKDAEGNERVYPMLNVGMAVQKAAAKRGEFEQQTAQPENVIDSQAASHDNGATDKSVIASGTCGEAGDNLTWTFYEDGSLVIEGSGKMADYLFPESYPLQSAPWLMTSLSTQIEIESVEIANGVTGIGNNAFDSYYCDKLSTVVIPDTVTHIGEQAFAFLTGLKSITLPASITYIGDYAFGETGLTDVYYKGSETEWNAVQKSVQDGLGIFSKYAPPTIHFQSSASSQYRENYRTVIENMIASCAAEKDNRNRTAYGTLYDLDGDGTDELVIVYRRNLSNVPTVLCDLYDIEDGQVKTVLEKLEVLTEVAGNSCEIAVVSYQGKTYLAFSNSYGWALGMYTQESTRLIDCSTGKETVILHKWFQTENAREDDTYSIGGVSCSAADYEAALGQIQTLVSLDISGRQNTLDELLKTLSSESGNADDSAGKWKQMFDAYLSKLQSRPDAKYLSVYTLYVDADDIPELLVELPTTAEGAQFCYYDGSAVQEQFLYSYSFSYIPGSGLFRENGGHMDVYYDSIYQLKNGSVQLIAHGEYGAEDNANVQRDAAGTPIYNYYWNGSKVDQASYYNMLNALFDTSREVSPYGGQSIRVEQALDDLGTNQVATSTVPSAGKPGPDDLKGQDGVASPTSGWLAEYQIKYVKGTTSGNAYLRWSPSNEGREYNRYVKEGEKVTVLASENGYSLVLASDGRAGWVTSKLLA